MPKPAFSRIALIGKHTPEIADSLRALRAFLRGRGCEVKVERETSAHIGDGEDAADYDALGAFAELALVLGGDGTMLAAARSLAPHGVPLAGVNQGRVGFMTDIALQDMQSSVGAILDGRYSLEARALLDAEILRDGRRLLHTVALNEAVVGKGSQGRLIEVEVRINGEYVYALRADGLIVATPTGSTAYALSAGGPMMHPSIPAWVMAPIAPHNLSNRPIVLSDANEVTIEVVAGRDVSANFDMQSLASLQHGDRILVSRAHHSVRFLHPKGWNYFATLRKKLGWNEGGA